MRRQVVIDASSLKRGSVQEPVNLGFVAQGLTLPVVSQAAIGRPLTVTEAICAGVRRSIVAIVFASVVALLMIDGLIFHLAVSSTGSLIVRPGFASTYYAMPFHLVQAVDTGLTIADIRPGAEELRDALASGSHWGVATHRDADGLKPWLSSVALGLTPEVRKWIDALAAGRGSTFDPDDNAPPVLPARFLARLDKRPVDDVARNLFTRDWIVPWSCADTRDATANMDFEEFGKHFDQYAEWLSATAPVDGRSRAQRLIVLIKLAAYRALYENNAETRAKEYADFLAAADDLILGIHAPNRHALSTSLASQSSGWCASYVAYVLAVLGEPEQRSAAEASFVATYVQSDKATSSPQDMIPVLALGGIARHRRLSSSTIGALDAALETGGADIGSESATTTFLEEIASIQGLGDRLTSYLLTRLRTASDVDSQIFEARALAGEATYLNPAQRSELAAWLDAQTSKLPYVSSYHDALGLFAMTQTLSASERELLFSQLKRATRFPPRTTNYNGDTIVTSNGDAAALAVGRLASRENVPGDVLDRLMIFADTRTDFAGMTTIVEGLAARRYAGVGDQADAIHARLLAASGDARRRATEIAIAVALLRSLSPHKREAAVDRLLSMWKTEQEPAGRIALAQVIGGPF